MRADDVTTNRRLARTSLRRLVWFLKRAAGDRAVDLTLLLAWCQAQDSDDGAQTVLEVDGDSARLVVRAPHRPEIEVALRVAGGGVPASSPASDDSRQSAAAPTRPSVFIGHGQDHQWRELADHLRDVHDLPVLTFESGARAGLRSADVLDALVRETDLAVLVHTPDCEDPEGNRHASDNVIHETGLFQGVLGPRRTIVARQQGCTSFANLEGVNELRFASGGISGVFGDLLGVLRREFPGR